MLVFALGLHIIEIAEGAWCGLRWRLLLEWRDRHRDARLGRDAMPHRQHAEAFQLRGNLSPPIKCIALTYFCIAKSCKRCPDIRFDILAGRPPHNIMPDK